MKIYGDSINSDIPYKTLLLSVNDTTEKVLAETLDKYGLAQEDHRFYLLVQQNIPPKSDRIRLVLPTDNINMTIEMRKKFVDAYNKVADSLSKVK